MKPAAPRVAGRQHPNLSGGEAPQPPPQSGDDILRSVMKRIQRDITAGEALRPSIYTQANADDGMMDTIPDTSSSSPGGLQGNPTRRAGGGAGTTTNAATTGARPYANLTSVLSSNEAQEEEGFGHQACPATLRFAIDYCRTSLDDKLTIASLGNMKDAMRSVFHCRALLDKLLKEVPQFAEYQEGGVAPTRPIGQTKQGDTSYALRQHKPGGSSATTASSATPPTTATTTHHRTAAQIAQEAQGYLNEFRREPVPFVQTGFVEDLTTGKVEAVVDANQPDFATTSISNVPATSAPTGATVTDATSQHHQQLGLDNNKTLSSSMVGGRGSAAKKSSTLPGLAAVPNTTSTASTVSPSLVPAPPRQGGSGTTTTESGLSWRLKTAGALVGLPTTTPRQEQKVMSFITKQTERTSQICQTDKSLRDMVSIEAYQEAKDTIETLEGTIHEQCRLMSSLEDQLHLSMTALTSRSSAISHLRSTLLKECTQLRRQLQHLAASGVMVGGSGSQTLQQSFSPDGGSYKRVNTIGLNSGGGSSGGGGDTQANGGGGFSRSATNPNSVTRVASAATSPSHHHTTLGQVLSNTNTNNNNRESHGLLPTVNVMSGGGNSSDYSSASAGGGAGPTSEVEAITAMPPPTSSINRVSSHSLSLSSSQPTAARGASTQIHANTNTNNNHLHAPNRGDNFHQPRSTSGSFSITPNPKGSVMVNPDGTYTNFNNTDDLQRNVSYGGGTISAEINQHSTGAAFDFTSTFSLLDTVLLAVENGKVLDWVPPPTASPIAATNTIKVSEEETATITSNVGSTPTLPISLPDHYDSRSVNEVTGDRVRPPLLIDRVDGDSGDVSSLHDNSHMQAIKLYEHLQHRNKEWKASFLRMQATFNLALKRKDKEIAYIKSRTDLDKLRSDVFAEITLAKEDMMNIRSGISDALEILRDEFGRFMTQTEVLLSTLGKEVRESRAAVTYHKAAVDLPRAMCELIQPMIYSEFAVGVHPTWNCTEQQNSDPLWTHMLHTHGADAAHDLRTDIQRAQQLLLYLQRHISQSHAMPHVNRPTTGATLHKLASLIIISQNCSNDLSVKIRETVEMDRYHSEQMARYSFRLKGVTFYQQVLTLRARNALLKGGINPDATPLPVRHRVSRIGEKAASLRNLRQAVTKARLENARRLWRLWQESGVDIWQGAAVRPLRDPLLAHQSLQRHITQNGSLILGILAPNLTFSVANLKSKNGGY